MDSTGLVAITGAGLGLGLALSVECAGRGFDVLATVPELSMGDAVLEGTAGLSGTVHVQVLDVTAPGGFRFPDELRVLINNAGIRRAYLPVEETPLDEWRKTFEVNFFGVVEVTRRAIPILRERGEGVICNISSRSVINPIPFLGPYRASKKALAGYSETLRTELAPFGIRVVEILPGPMETNINADSITHRVADAVAFEPYAPMAMRQREVNSAGPPTIPAADAAREVVDAILDDTGPMRYATCDDSKSALERWGRWREEEWMLRFMEPLVPEGNK
jgi:NAD(P)-dependent dehydrogenase (short-subunit alcohol dehydrogenase family)